MRPAWTRPALADGATWRRSALVVLTAAAPAVSRLSEIGMLSATVGVEGGGDTPSRILMLPVLGWLLVGLYAWSSGLRGGTAVAATLLLALSMDALVEAARFWAAPDFEKLGRAQVLYVTSAVHGLFALAGAATALAVVRYRFFLPLAMLAAAVAAWSLVVGAVSAGAALALGGALAYVGWQRRGDIEIPVVRPHALLGLAVAIALLLRGALALSVWNSARLEYPSASVTGPEYDRMATTILSGATLSEPASDFNAYVLFLVALYALIGRAFLAIGLLQALIGCLVVVGAYVFALRYTRSVAVASITALAVAIDSLLVTSSATILREALSVPAFAMVLALLLSSANAHDQRGRRWLVAGAGVASGLLVATSVPHLAFIPLLALWLVAVAPSGSRLRHGVLPAALFLVLAAATAAPAFAFRQIYPTTPSVSRVAVAWSYVPPWDQRLGVFFTPEDLIRLVWTRPADVLAAEIDALPRNADGLLFHSVHNRFDPAFLVGHTPLAATLEAYMLVTMLAGMVVAALDRRYPASAKMLLLLALAYLIAIDIGVVSSRLGFRHRAPYDMLLLMSLAIGALWSVSALRRAAWPSPWDARVSASA